MAGDDWDAQIPEAFEVTDHYQNPGVKHRDWMDEKVFTLATVDNLTALIDTCIAADRFSLDLETSGLDNRVLCFDDGTRRTVDQIAGVCLSPDGVNGYYVPLRHVRVSETGGRTPLECNIPMALFDKEFRRLIAAVDAGETVAIFHNGKFDQEFLQFPGGKPYGEWDKPSHWEDTLILAYLRNSRERDKRLKSLSKVELGIDQVELVELFPEDTPKDKLDFSTLDPTDQGVLWYGGGDGICTWLLYDVLAPPVLNNDTDGRNQKIVYQIEKGCVAATRWMERNQIHVDIGKVRELVNLGQQEWFDSIVEVYRAASELLGRNVMPGKYKALTKKFDATDPHSLLPVQLKRAEARGKAEYPDPPGKIKDDNRNKTFPLIYDVNAPKQLGQMFDEMGVPGLRLTEKSGQIKTSKDEIERVIEEAGKKFPFMGLIKRFREVSKALSGYLNPMLLACDPDNHTMRINFNGHKVDTGRFSTPAKDKNRGHLQGWPQVNLQSIPATYDPNRPECMTRLRECITARKKGAYIVAIDYAGVELRLVTNLSYEPLWLAEFFHCAECDRTFEKGDGEGTPMPPPARCPNCGSDKIGDLHTLTALSLFGDDAMSKDNWKALRGDAKATNFLLCYGGGGAAVSRRTGVDKNEGWRIKNAFDRTYLGLKRWWHTQHTFAKQHGFVRTAMGRKYPVPDINNQDGGFRSKAERNSVNGPIQGTSADITKTAMVLVYKLCKKRGWLDKVMMIITMHDELVFEMDGDVMQEAIKAIIPVMTRNPYVLNRKWPIPLTCDVEIGHDWTVPWDLNSMHFGEVKFIGNKKIKGAKKTPDGHRWEDLQCYPDELVPWFGEEEAASADASLASTMNRVGGEDDDQPPPSAPSGPAEPAPETAATGAQVAEEIPVPEGEAFEFRLTVPLTVGTMERLAGVLARTRDRGTRILKLLANDGTPLDLSAAFGEEVQVHYNHFMSLAELDGL